MSLIDSLQEKLDANEVIVIDGATGTEISRRGVEIDAKRSWSANANITFPDLVRDIHRDYILAGAEIITANTFSASRATLALDGLSDRTEEINTNSVRLAMEAREMCDAAQTVLVAGSMSTCVPKGQPKVAPSYAEALEDYREQASILSRAGVDLIILEMFVRTLDIRAAIEAANETNLPLWVGLSCESHDGQIYLGIMGRHAGETIADAVQASASQSVKAICIMHSPPHTTADALRELKVLTSLPIGAYAHGGTTDDQIGRAAPAPPGSRSLTGVDPEKYMKYAQEWMECGATIIGGCCGTTPEHIKSLNTSDIRTINR